MSSSKTASKTNIKEKMKLFFTDRKHSNNLIDIISLTEAEDTTLVTAAIKALCKIFTKLLKNKEMYLEKNPTTEQEIQELTGDEKYVMWLRERYRDTTTQLCLLLTHTDANVQELSLGALMRCVQEEGLTPPTRTSLSSPYFPLSLFESTIRALLSDSVDCRHLLGGFQEYMEKDDIRYFTMKNILKVLKEKEDSKTLSVFDDNVLTLLEQCAPPDTSEDTLTNCLTCNTDTGDLPQCKMLSPSEHKKLFSSAWVKFLQRQLSTSVYKRVLLNLHQKVLPYMTSPLLLADFLTDSYNIGGAISLLALNGLFILINSHNLNYPDFYDKLYRLLEPGVLYVKYRARFFYLTDLFLTSTHLPAYLVAAFIKRLARLSLTAPPDALVMLLPLIYNLLHRHPSCQPLIHRPHPADVSEDPFLSEQEDPAQCHALDSSLWEIKCHQSHYYHKVASEARKIDFPLPNTERDLSDLLETTAASLMKQETKKKVSDSADIPVNYDAPRGLFGGKEDQFTGLWKL